MIGDGVALAVFVISGITFMVVAQIAGARARARRGPTVRVAGGPAQWLPYLFWVPYVVVGARLGPIVPVPDAVRLVALSLIIGGIGFALWAMFTLGRHYDLVLEVHADHQLVRTGPFAWVRHPLYTGISVHYLGACLATGNVVLALGTIFVSLPTLVARARAEERLLREQLGPEYERYAREVPMLVPGLRGRR
jgi:protein-S-isoprenylcysteine O-methyltransferase Ste14